MVFAKGNFESGIAAKILNDFAENPIPYLGEKTQKKLRDVNTELSRKFAELAFDEMAESRWKEAMSPEADNIDVGPLLEADLSDDLFETSENPY